VEIKYFFLCKRVGHIFKCPSTVVNVDDIHVNLLERDKVSHLFLSDDLTELKLSALRPKARVLH